MTGGEQGAVLVETPAAQGQQVSAHTSLPDLYELFAAWYKGEAALLGADQTPLSNVPMSGVVINHSCYGKMAAAWDAKCSCGENKSLGNQSFRSLIKLVTE